MNLKRLIIDSPLFSKRSSDYIRWYPKSLTFTEDLATWEVNRLSPKGLYIHIPFCDQLCRFCPFNKRLLDDELLERFINAACEELDIYSEFVSNNRVLDFVYFGGGTPSVMSPGQLETLLSKVASRFTIGADTEVTLESHPRHLNREFLKDVKELGVNRISSGIQSFNDTILTKLGSKHTSKDAVLAIQSVGEIMESMSIDLLYRCPDQTLELWIKDLDELEKYSFIDHVSCYSLILKTDKDQPSESLEVEMALSAFKILENRGMHHYASCASGGFDMCIPGKECEYEMGHWQAPQCEFIAIGPGAIGFVAGRTTINMLSIPDYCESLVERKSLPYVSTTLASSDELERRYWVLGVKTLGVELREYENIFGKNPYKQFAEEFSFLLANGLAIIEDERLSITKLGRLYVDTISATFFSHFERDVPHPEEPEIRKIEVAQSRVRSVVVN